MVISGSLSHIYFFCFLIIEIGIVYEVIIKDDVGGINGFCCLDGQRDLGHQDRSLPRIRCLAFREMLMGRTKVQSEEFSCSEAEELLYLILHSLCFTLHSFFAVMARKPCKRMGWEREYFGDFILHAEALQGTGGNDGSIVFAIFQPAELFLQCNRVFL